MDKNTSNPYPPFCPILLLWLGIFTCLLGIHLVAGFYPMIVMGAVAFSYIGVHALIAWLNP